MLYFEFNSLLYMLFRSSWHRLGDMSREKAMEKYVALLSDRVAEWKLDKTDVRITESVLFTAPSF